MQMTLYIPGTNILKALFCLMIINSKVVGEIYLFVVVGNCPNWII